jgi:hypothetical protein
MDIGKFPVGTASVLDRPDRSRKVPGGTSAP